LLEAPRTVTGRKDPPPQQPGRLEQRQGVVGGVLRACAAAPLPAELDGPGPESAENRSASVAPPAGAVLGGAGICCGTDAGTAVGAAGAGGCSCLGALGDSLREDSITAASSPPRSASTPLIAGRARAACRTDAPPSGQRGIDRAGCSSGKERAAAGRLIPACAARPSEGSRSAATKTAHPARRRKLVRCVCCEARHVMGWAVAGSRGEQGEGSPLASFWMFFLSHEPQTDRGS